MATGRTQMMSLAEEDALDTRSTTWAASSGKWVRGYGSSRQDLLAEPMLMPIEPSF